MQNSQKPSRSDAHLNWRDFQESAIEDQKLQRRLVAKSLDVPYGAFDEMRDIQVNKGLSGFGVAALSAALLVGGVVGGLGLMSLLRGLNPTIEKPFSRKTIVIEKTTQEGWKLGTETVIPPGD